MSRRRVVAKRELMPDPILESAEITRLVNCLMEEGKKGIAEKIAYGALAEAAIRAKVIEAQKPKKDGVDVVSHRISSSSRKALLVKLNDKSRRSVRELFERVIDKLKPTLEVRARRVGGATYQVPVEVPMVRRMKLAMGWLIEAARGRSEKGMMMRLAAEMLDALEGRGGAIKKRDDTHRMAKANQAFAHFRW